MADIYMEGSVLKLFPIRWIQNKRWNFVVVTFNKNLDDICAKSRVHEVYLSSPTNFLCFDSLLPLILSLTEVDVRGV